MTASIHVLCELFLTILGDESGMLEDMHVVVSELASVSFQVRKKNWRKKKKFVSARDRTGDLARVRRT